MRQFPAKVGGRDSYSDDLLRHVDADGAEYFTVKATGQSGMSQSGLARFVGVQPPSIDKWVKKVQKADSTSNSLPECLKSFAGCNLILQSYTDPEERNILADGFCAALIEYYASYSKRVRKEYKAKAQQTINLIKHLGMRLFIHKKTGWRSSYCSSSLNDFFEQEFEAHRVRLSVRQILRIEDHPELTSAIEEYRQKHRLSLRIFSDVYNEMNTRLQGLKAKEIREQNNLSRSVLLRDHYDTHPLMNYSALSRLTANQIRYHDKHPVEAVCIAFELFLPKHTPQPVTLVENVYKADKRLKAAAKQRRLIEGIQLSLFTDKASLDT